MDVSRILYNCGINYIRTARKLLSERDITSVNSGGKSSNTVSLWSYAVLSTLNGTRPFMLTKSNATYNSPPANSHPPLPSPPPLLCAPCVRGTHRSRSVEQLCNCWVIYCWALSPAVHLLFRNVFNKHALFFATRERRCLIAERGGVDIRRTGAHSGRAGFRRKSY